MLTVDRFIFYTKSEEKLDPFSFLRAKTFTHAIECNFRANIFLFEHNIVCVCGCVFKVMQQQIIGEVANLITCLWQIISVFNSDRIIKSDSICESYVQMKRVLCFSDSVYIKSLQFI